jgi:hypothetical protein
VTVFDYWAGGLLPDIFTGCPGSIFRYLSASSPVSWDALGLVTLSTLTSDQGAEQLSVRLASILNGLLRSGLDLGTIPASRFVPIILKSGWGAEYHPWNGLQRITQSNHIGEATGDIVRSYEQYGDFFNAAANVTTAYDSEVYAPSVPWVVILLLCSLTALGAGVVGILCNVRSLAPRVFDPVYAYTYSERFGLDDRPGGGTLKIEDRARLLGDMKIRLGDLNGDSDVGHIGVARAESVSPLVYGRLYE